MGSLESPRVQSYYGAFREGLVGLGYLKGRNVAIELRADSGILATKLVTSRSSRSSLRYDRRARCAKGTDHNSDHHRPYP